MALIPGAADIGCFAAPTLNTGQLFGWETIMVRWQLPNAIVFIRNDYSTPNTKQPQHPRQRLQHIHAYCV